MIAGSSLSHRRLLWAAGVGGALFLVEIFSSILSGSLLLLTDAFHVSTDVVALGLALYASFVSSRPPDSRRTFGYQRAEIVAAFVNAILLWVISAVVAFEAIRRIQSPSRIWSDLLVGVGVVGLLGNAVMWILLHSPTGSLNLEGVRLHVLSDALGSLSAILGGIVILGTGWAWVDPLLSFVVLALIVRYAFDLTRKTLHILLEGAPPEFDPKEIEKEILSIEGVRGVHDLHAWILAGGDHAMSAHIVLDDPSRGVEVVSEIRRRILPRHQLGHGTLEVEGPESLCEGCR